MRLNHLFLKNNPKVADEMGYDKKSTELKERIIQFGTGNFLRGMPDWLIQQLNNQDLFNGRIVMVKSTSDGQEIEFNKQDGLYTLLIRGVEQGEKVNQASIISSVSRCINPYDHWQEYLQCAENPDIEFIFSNTTEIGIVYEPEDQLKDQPASSFPGKLTQYLYHRYQFFNGSQESGMIIFPCELIERNGDQLREIILALATDWKLPESFSQWIKDHNYFLNTLVDRIVPGFPNNEADTLQNRLGYEDRFIATCEPYYLWAIEGPKEIENKIPFRQGGITNVIWADIYPYKTRKVRILNGAHISTMPIGLLYGLETVGECIHHEVLEPYIKDIIYDEIIPSIENIDRDMLIDFANAVEDRFKNPYIHHQLSSISLNGISKFKERIIPSIIGYQKKTGEIPKKLAFSFAALIAFYQGSELKGNKMTVHGKTRTYEIIDDKEVLAFFIDVWSENKSPKNHNVLIKEVLANESIWKINLLEIKGLYEAVNESFECIMKIGMQEAMNIKNVKGI